MLNPIDIMFNGGDIIKEKELIKKLIKLFRPFKLKILIVVVIITISALLSMLTPIISQHIMDDGLINRNMQLVIKFSLLGLAIVIVDQLLNVIEVKYRSYIENMVAFDLEYKAFKHVLHMDMTFFWNTNYSEIMDNLKTDVSKISSICNRTTFFILTSIFRIVVGVVGISIIDWRLSILVLAFIPFRYFIVKILSKHKKNIFREYIDSHREYSGWYGDSLAGIKEIKIWNLEAYKLSQFIKKQKRMIKQEIKLAYIESGNLISETFFNKIITTSLYLVGGYLIMHNNLSVGKLFAFITYSTYITEPIFAIMNIGFTFAGILPSVERYINFIEQGSEGQALIGQSNIDKVDGSLELKNVSFYYKKDNVILKNMNFKIEKGEKVAIVGKNGAGKSTVVNLLLRLISPKDGQVLLDGKDVQTLSLKQYRDIISVVNQDIYLFNSTIKENIIFNSKKNYDDMYIATQKCGVDKFVNKLKDKYESKVGDRGSKLSGGERQKIAMARALVRNSKILILDEATANYDAKSEMQMNEVIENEFENQTVIIITHRAEILQKVDKVIVLNSGMVEAIGTHNELIKSNELYKSLFDKKQDFINIC